MVASIESATSISIDSITLNSEELLSGPEGLETPTAVTSKSNKEGSMLSLEDNSQRIGLKPVSCRCTRQREK